MTIHNKLQTKGIAIGCPLQYEAHGWSAFGHGVPRHRQPTERIDRGSHAMRALAALLVAAAADDCCWVQRSVKGTTFKKPPHTIDA